MDSPEPDVPPVLIWDGASVPAAPVAACMRLSSGNWCTLTVDLEKGSRGDKKTDVTAVSSLDCPGLPRFKDLPWQEVDRMLKEAGLVREGWRYSSARIYVKRGSPAAPRNHFIAYDQAVKLLRQWRREGAGHQPAHSSGSGSPGGPRRGRARGPGGGDDWEPPGGGGPWAARGSDASDTAAAAAALPPPADQLAGAWGSGLLDGGGAAAAPGALAVHSFVEQVLMHRAQQYGAPQQLQAPSAADLQAQQLLAQLPLPGLGLGLSPPGGAAPAPAPVPHDAAAAAFAAAMMAAAAAGPGGGAARGGGGGGAAEPAARSRSDADALAAALGLPSSQWPQKRSASPPSGGAPSDGLGPLHGGVAKRRPTAPGAGGRGALLQALLAAGAGGAAAAAAVAAPVCTAAAGAGADPAHALAELLGRAQARPHVPPSGVDWLSTLTAVVNGGGAAAAAPPAPSPVSHAPCGGQAQSADSGAGAAAAPPSPPAAARDASDGGAATARGVPSWVDAAALRAAVGAGDLGAFLAAARCGELRDALAAPGREHDALSLTLCSEDEIAAMGLPAGPAKKLQLAVRAYRAAFPDDV